MKVFSSTRIWFSATTPILLTLPALSSAHTRFTTLHINGISQGDGICIRQDRDPGTTTNFIPSLTGPEMACGIDGTIPVPDICSLNGGDTIALEHRMWPDGSQPGAIDDSHKGSVSVYMKAIGDEADEVTGGGWFKIFWDGYDAATEQWGTDHMNSNNGLVTTTVPESLNAGDYLVRSEVLALQEVGEPQFYVGCAQVKINAGGNGFENGGFALSDGDMVAIPGHVDMDTPAVNVNIYQAFTFDEFGPKVIGSDGSSSTQSGTSGLKPISSSTGTNSISEPRASADPRYRDDIGAQDGEYADEVVSMPNRWGHQHGRWCKWNERRSSHMKFANRCNGN